MESVYTLREFRAKTKEAFDKADEQVDVIIERSGVRYILIPEDCYKELLKPEAAPKIIKTKQDAKLAVKPLQVNKKSHTYTEPLTYKKTSNWGA